MLLDGLPELLVEQRAFPWARRAASGRPLAQGQPRRGDRAAPRQSGGSVPPLPLPHHHELRQRLPQAPQPGRSYRGDQAHAGRAPGVSALRALGDGFGPAVVTAIDDRLRSVAERDKADILLAVESAAPGSFPPRTATNAFLRRWIRR